MSTDPHADNLNRYIFLDVHQKRHFREMLVDQHRGGLWEYYKRSTVRRRNVSFDEALTAFAEMDYSLACFRTQEDFTEFMKGMVTAGLTAIDAVEQRERNLSRRNFR